MAEGFDAAMWKSLLIVSVDARDAKMEFANIGIIQAMHPTNHPISKPISLIFYDLHRDMDHYLFKARSDYAGREFAMLERLEDFQQDRAERVRWIKPTLMAPDFIYEHSEKRNRFLYVCRTGLNCFFAVVVDRYSQRVLHFVTAFVVDSERWKNKRHSLIRHHPPKNNSKIKKGAIVAGDP